MNQFPSAVVLFFIGILCAQQMSFLPPLHSLFISIAISSSAIFYFRHSFKAILIVILGFCYTLCYATFLNQPPWPHTLENKSLLVTGKVISIPIVKQGKIYYNFRLLSNTIHYNVQVVSKTQQKVPHVGESWQFLLKAKRIQFLKNPGSFDFEQSFYQKKLQAKAVVIPSKLNKRISPAGYHFPVQQLREKMMAQIPNNIRADPLWGIVLALALGWSAEISQEQWRVFRATGTNHLVAISGLHMGLVALFMTKLMGAVWNRLPRGPLLIPTLRVQAIGGVLAASIYGCLSGLSPSTQRALIMICVAVISRFSIRNITTCRALILALAVMMLLNPFVTFNTGFWLSFIALGLIVYGMNGRAHSSGIWWRYGRVQWVVGVGMLPTLLVFFQQSTFLAFPANVIAIPWISFLVVPCCLLGMSLLMISRALANLVFKLAIVLLHVIWIYLEKLSSCKLLIWQYAYKDFFEQVFAHIAAYVSLLPQGLLSRTLSFIWWLPSVLHVSPILPDNTSLQFVVFDVGQGLATLIRTSHHIIIYDTGIKLGESIDMGAQVIVPYLRKIGAHHLDALIVSHGDNDHIGGSKAILESLPVKMIITSVPERFHHLKVLRCQDGMKWSWDGVEFRFLSPSQQFPMKGNDTSCVLKVTSGQHTLLLTGDIEKKAEKYLLEKHVRDLPSQVLLVPHHGSKSSSTVLFLKKVAPKYAIFSYGYLNAYHHPDPEVLKRYQRGGVHCLNTVLSGAITMTFKRNSGIVTVNEYRKQHLKFWHQPP